jgi:hypothetical protein
MDPNQNSNQNPLVDNDNSIVSTEDRAPVQNDATVQENAPVQAGVEKPVRKNTFLYVMLGVAALSSAALIVVILMYGWPH